MTGSLKFTSKENLQRELNWENTRTKIEFISLTQFRKIEHWEMTFLIRDCLPPLFKQRYPEIPKEPYRQSLLSLFLKVKTMKYVVNHIQSGCATTAVSSHVNHNPAKFLKPRKSAFLGSGAALQNSKMCFSSMKSLNLVWLQYGYLNYISARFPGPFINLVLEFVGRWNISQFLGTILWVWYNFMLGILLLNTTWIKKLSLV